MQNMVTEENTQEKRGRGRPRKMVNNLENKPKGKRGRPRKNPEVQVNNTNVDPINNVLPDMTDINNILAGVGKTVNYGASASSKPVYNTYSFDGANYSLNPNANAVGKFNNYAVPNDVLPGLNYYADDITMPGVDNINDILPNVDGMMPGTDDVNGILPDLTGLEVPPEVPQVPPTSQSPVTDANNNGTIPMMYSDTEPSSSNIPNSTNDVNNGINGIDDLLSPNANPASTPVNTPTSIPANNVIPGLDDINGMMNDDSLPGTEQVVPGADVDPLTSMGDAINDILPDINTPESIAPQMPEQIVEPTIPQTPVQPVQPGPPPQMQTPQMPNGPVVTQTTPQVPVQPEQPSKPATPVVPQNNITMNQEMPGIEDLALGETTIPGLDTIPGLENPAPEMPSTPQIPEMPEIPSVPQNPGMNDAMPEMPEMDEMIPGLDGMSPLDGTVPDMNQVSEMPDMAIPTSPEGIVPGADLVQDAGVIPGLDAIPGLENPAPEMPSMENQVSEIPQMPDASQIPGMDATMPEMPGMDGMIPGLDELPPLDAAAPDMNQVPEMPEMPDASQIPGMDAAMPGMDEMIPGLDGTMSNMDAVTPGTEEMIPGLDQTMPDLNAMPGMDAIPGMDAMDPNMTEAVQIPGLDDLENMEGVDELGDLDGMLPGYGTAEQINPVVDGNLQGNSAQAVYNDYNANTPSIDESQIDYNNYYEAPNYQNNIQAQQPQNVYTSQPVQNNYNQFDMAGQDQVQSLKPNVNYSMSSFNGLLTADKKVVTFIGTTKNGTSFLVNNLAALFSSIGINTAILDMTKNKNSYYIYTKNEEELRKIAYTSIDDLRQGKSNGIHVDHNLTVYTALPNDGKDYSNAEQILSTIVQNHSVVLIDCDYSTDPSYFALCQEIYLVQSLDILTIQPLTAFLRDLKTQGVLEPEKVRVVINKNMKVGSLTTKVLIAGMSFYNDPAMSFMTELFNKDMVKYCEIPFDEKAYSKYLESMVNCNVSLSSYSQAFIAKLRILGEMVYPLTSKQSYGKSAGGFGGGFQAGPGGLNKMKGGF